MGLMFCLLIVACLFAAFAPETDIGKACRRVLVDTPARLLNGSPLKMLVAVIVLLGLVAFAAAMPEMIAIFGMTDLSIYLDVVALSLIFGAAAGLKTAGLALARAAKRWRLALTRPRSSRPRVRARRIRKPRRPPPNEDAWSPGAWAIA